MKKFTEDEIRAMAESCIECARHKTCTPACRYYKPAGRNDCEGLNTFAAYAKVGPMLLQLLEERERPKGSAPIRLFVSQPMSGRSEEEIRAMREEAVRFVRKMYRCEVELLDSYFPGFEPDHPLQYLARSLALLAEADLAYFAEGWQDARGCRIEKACADEYGIDHIVCEGSDGE